LLLTLGSIAGIVKVMNRTTEGALWTCPECGRAFANRNQSHSCANLTDLDHHLVGKPPLIREIFEAFRARVEAIGPCIVMPQKTRIAFQVRMSFAQLTPRQGWIDGHLVLAARHADWTRGKITTYSPGNHTHEFRLVSPADLDETFQRYLEMAYAVGRQEHLKGRGRHGSAVEG
jgi:hypothetical protein